MEQHDIADDIARMGGMNDRAPAGLLDSLDAACGTAAPLRVARIDEAACIGCTLCIAACPFDAIIGAARRLHAVLPALCTGCELCVAPCPVDCIRMLPAGRAWSPEDARAARSRYDARCRRLANPQPVRRDPSATSPRDGRAPTAATQQDHPQPTNSPRQAGDDNGRARRQQAVAAALARARARRASPPR